MERINTEITRYTIEINDREYEIAENTIGIAEKLRKAEQDTQKEPRYKMWIAELEILLGRDAMREIFPGNKDDINIDLLHRIYLGVATAFKANGEASEHEYMERDAREMRDVLAPITDTMKLVDKFSKVEPSGGIHRPTK